MYAYGGFNSNKGLYEETKLLNTSIKNHKISHLIQGHV